MRQGYMICVLLGLLAITKPVIAQDNDDIVKATELTIPSSGAFNLMGVNPALVSRPGFTKDFSISNFIKDGKLLDDIALDAQPFWVLFFKNKSINDYQSDKLKYLRFLSHINVSLGTTKKNDLRKFAWSGKITLQKDPMMDKVYVAQIEKMTEDLGFNKVKGFLAFEIDGLEQQVDAEQNPVKADSLRQLLKIKQAALESLHENVTKAVLEAKKKLAQKYIEEHWADPVVDIGAGQVFNYNTPTLDSINFSTDGVGVWINPAIGIKLSKNPEANKIQLAGLLKYIRIGGNDDIYAGANIRYGNGKVNAFAEYIYEKNGKRETNTVAYGLTYKIDNKKIIEVGLRHLLDNKFQLKNFYPAVSLNWALAKDILK